VISTLRWRYGRAHAGFRRGWLRRALLQCLLRPQPMVDGELRPAGIATAEQHILKLPSVALKWEGQSCGSGGAVRARLRLFAHEIEELLNRCIELPRQRQSQ
jgi:hypothetical protein